MELRGKKCQTCGHITGTMNTQCEECDGIDLIDYVQDIELGERAFWGVTVSKPIETTEQAWQFEETVLASADKWRDFYDGHSVEVRATVGEGIEVSIIEMHWYFEQADAHSSIDLQTHFIAMRPGLMSEAVISVEFYDELIIEDVE